MANNSKLGLPAEGTSVKYEEHEWNVLRKIADGIFSQVFVLEDARNRRRKYAMKVELQEGCARPVLKLDVHLLRLLYNRPGFPEFIAAGRTGHYKFCVMTFIGPELGTLQRMMPYNRFTPSTAYRVMLQTLDRLQVMHELGWLNRDVKANNFAVGIGEDANTIYMLDFGLARRYKNKDGTRRRRRPLGPCVGTIPFAPLASNNLEDQSPRDDLEGWFYMCAFMVRGHLPWFINRHAPLSLAEAREWKKFLRGSYKNVFFGSMPNGWQYIFDLIINTGYLETPDYEAIRKAVYQMIHCLGLNMNLPFDWLVEPRLMNEMAQAQALTSSRVSPKELPASPAPPAPIVPESKTTAIPLEAWLSSHYAWRDDVDVELEPEEHVEEVFVRA